MQKLYLETESDRRSKSCKSKIPKYTKAIVKPLRFLISRLTFHRSLEAICKLYESNHPCISMYFEIRSTTTLIHGALYLLSTSCLVLMHVKYSKTRIDVSIMLVCKWTGSNDRQSSITLTY